MDNTELINIAEELKAQTLILQEMLGRSAGGIKGAASDLEDAIKKSSKDLKTAGGIFVGAGRTAREMERAQSRATVQQKKEAEAKAKAVAAAEKLDKQFGIIAGTTAGITRDFEAMRHRLGNSINNTARDLTRTISSLSSDSKRSMNSFTTLTESTFGTLSQGAELFVRNIRPLSYTALALGKGLGLVVALLGKLAVAGFNQQKQLFENYQTLAKTGMSASGDFNAITQMMRDAGFSLAQSADVIKTFQQHSTTVAAFGRTAAEGARNMARFSGELIESELGRHLREMGYQREELLDIMMQYSAGQLTIGKMQNRSTREQAEAVYRYVRELDTATRLTGVSNAELLKQEERRRNDERVMAAAAMRPEEYNQMQPLFQLLASIDPNLQAGVEHIWAGRGAVTSDQARSAIMQIPELREILAATAAGGDSFTAVQRIVQNLERTMGADGVFTALMANVGEIQGIGGGIRQREFIERLRQAKSLEEVNALLSEQTDKTSGAARSMVSLEEGVMKTQQATDQMVSNFTFVSKAAETLARTVGRAATVIADKVTEISPDWATNFGGSVVGSAGSPSPAPSRLPSQAALAAGGAGFRPGSPGGAGAGAGAGAARVLESTYVSNARPLLDLIGRVEGGPHGYNALVYGAGTPRSANLTDMSIAQVMEYQAGMRGRGHASTAVGKYQVIASTLQEAIQGLSLSPSEKFSPEVQDRIGEFLLNRRIARGQGDPNSIVRQLSQEWAALPMDRTGRGYYDGQNGNKAGVQYDALVSALRASGVSGFAKGGIASGPMSGHLQLLHGTEAVVPLPDGKSIPIEPAGPLSSYSGFSPKVEIDTAASPVSVRMPEMTEMVTNMKEQLEMMGKQINKLDDLVDAMRKNNDINNKILRMSQ